MCVLPFIYLPELSVHGINKISKYNEILFLNCRNNKMREADNWLVYRVLCVNQIFFVAVIYERLLPSTERVYGNWDNWLNWLELCCGLCAGKRLSLLFEQLYLVHSFHGGQDKKNTFISAIYIAAGTFGSHNTYTDTNTNIGDCKIKKLIGTIASNYFTKTHPTLLDPLRFEFMKFRLTSAFAISQCYPHNMIGKQHIFQYRKEILDFGGFRLTRVPGRYGNIFEDVISKHMLPAKFMRTFLWNYSWINPTVHLW